ncbi:hypothetical protein IV203_037499 [Nitzschia inconspicua]|uniref:Uncharacterized protein n=1 Tax=Nitzschia inconspicua TaxID=303405 RepID=A0A9K3LLF0_9STRA|nr:hypothetical protein IV203_037499 [Nitzschia inconspicua]
MNQRIFYNPERIFILLLVSSLWASVAAWQKCSDDAGGGMCPDGDTCCPTDIPGVSGCISGRSRDPPNAQGECCDTLTGCSYGYSCGVEEHVIYENNHKQTQTRPICLRNEPHFDYLNAPKTNRYETCRLSPDIIFYASKLNGFPVNPGGDPHLGGTEFNLGYYSTLGSITEDVGHQNRFASIETVLVIIHGSGRTAEDYLCAGVSVIPHSATKLENVVNDNYNKYLVIAPYFAADTDTKERNMVDNLLYWAERGETAPLGHTWRYGADALNYNISSYGSLDSMLEYIISSNSQFPNLHKVVVAGHSAGGQVVHRWALLSSTPVIWEQTNVEIRAVVANPRSYCYFDNRRVLFHGNITNNTANDLFAVPSQEDITSCPSYSQWQWGLEPGGDVVSHYKERILNDTTPSKLKRRYGARNVFYLTGELDLVEQMDRCETQKFQGINRNHRARNYHKALSVYFKDSSYYRHQFHVVPGSPHDHVLMFQSEEGRSSLFGRKGITTSYDTVQGYVDGIPVSISKMSL